MPGSQTQHIHRVPMKYEPAMSFLSGSKTFQSVDCRVHDRKVERKKRVEVMPNLRIRFSLKAMESI